MPKSASKSTVGDEHSKRKNSSPRNNIPSNRLTTYCSPGKTKAEQDFEDWVNSNCEDLYYIRDDDSPHKFTFNFTRGIAASLFRDDVRNILQHIDFGPLIITVDIADFALPLRGKRSDLLSSFFGRAKGLHRSFTLRIDARSSFPGGQFATSDAMDIETEELSTSGSDTQMGLDEVASAGVSSDVEMGGVGDEPQLYSNTHKFNNRPGEPIYSTEWVVLSIFRGLNRRVDLSEQQSIKNAIFHNFDGSPNSNGRLRSLSMSPNGAAMRPLSSFEPQRTGSQSSNDSPQNHDMSLSPPLHRNLDSPSPDNSFGKRTLQKSSSSTTRSMSSSKKRSLDSHSQHSNESHQQHAIAMSPVTTHSSSQESTSVPSSMVDSSDLSLKAMFSCNHERIDMHSVTIYSWCLLFDTTQSLTPADSIGNYKHAGYVHQRLLADSSTNSGTPAHVLFHYDGDPTLISPEKTSKLQTYLNMVLETISQRHRTFSVSIGGALDRPGESFPVIDNRSLDFEVASPPEQPWDPLEDFSWFGRHFATFEAFLSNFTRDADRSLTRSLRLPDFDIASMQDLLWVLKECPGLQSLQMGIGSVKTIDQLFDSHGIRELDIELHAECCENLHDAFFVDDPEPDKSMAIFQQLRRLSFTISSWTDEIQAFMGRADDLGIDEIQIRCSMACYRTVKLPKEEWPMSMEATETKVVFTRRRSA